MQVAATPYIEHDDTDSLLDVLKRHRRTMLWGDMGVGKSTLAVKLLHLASALRPGFLLELDPGNPPFGVPGTVCLGSSRNKQVFWQDLRPLCTLNSSRFRLPLVLEAGKLLSTGEKMAERPIVLIDPPGVVRGVGGAELLMALVSSLQAEAILLLAGTDKIPLAHELTALDVPIFRIGMSGSAKIPAKNVKTRARTQLWDQFLREAQEERYDLGTLHLLGTPPPLSAQAAWKGRQVALFDQVGEVVGMGEVLELVDNGLSGKIVKFGSDRPYTLLLRDAARNKAGLLATINPQRKLPRRPKIPAELGLLHGQTGADRSPPLSCQVGSAWATLVGGVFGDPLLHVKVRNEKRSFLFDLGDPRRLPAKVAHQVEAVFLSHAHLDHIGGFIWLLRCRIGPFGPCRIFGPVGITDRINHFLRAITWDRIDDLGPVFEIAEIQGSKLIRTRLQPGKEPVSLPAEPIDDTIIMQDESLTIRAEVCDHKIPSVAYALEFVQDIRIRKDRLKQFGLTPGPWLKLLKQCIASGSLASLITLPDGSKRSTSELAEQLSFIRPGKKLVYIADMADTTDNRKKAITLAKGAHTLFCEAAFASTDKDKARATQHLTTTAAVHIARSAGVRQLVPFHFSKRYEFKQQLLYEELQREAGYLVVLGS